MEYKIESCEGPAEEKAPAFRPCWLERACESQENRLSCSVVEVWMSSHAARCRVDEAVQCEFWRMNGEIKELNFSQITAILKIN